MDTQNSSVERTLRRLEKNGFSPYFVKSVDEARVLFFDRLLPDIHPGIVSYADSLTLRATGILDGLRRSEGLRFIDTFDPALSWDEKIERRRQALLADLFLTGSNAVTENGELVNLDMIGNRTGGIVFGPRHVVLTIGVNKITKDVEAAMKRIKATSAPLNAKRHEGFDLPCQKTGYCVDCGSAQRICNAWSIVERCFPRGRIRIILIGAELGL